MKFAVGTVDFIHNKLLPLRWMFCTSIWLNTATEDHTDITTGSEFAHTLLENEINQKGKTNTARYSRCLCSVSHIFKYTTMNYEKESSYSANPVKKMFSARKTSSLK